MLAIPIRGDHRDIGPLRYGEDHPESMTKDFNDKWYNYDQSEFYSHAEIPKFFQIYFIVEYPWERGED